MKFIALIAILLKASTAYAGETDVAIQYLKDNVGINHGISINNVIDAGVSNGIHTYAIIYTVTYINGVYLKDGKPIAILTEEQSQSLNKKPQH